MTTLTRRKFLAASTAASVALILPVGLRAAPDADHGDEDRLGKADRDRGGKPQEGFDTNHKRDDRQDHGAGIACQLTELSGAEAETLVLRMTTRIPIGKARDRKRSCMGRHMEAIGKQRHRAKDHTGDDFSDHHDGGQCDNNPCAPFVAGMIPSEEDMRVAPVLNRL